jgi:YfiR/HmsC-like
MQSPITAGIHRISRADRLRPASLGALILALLLVGSLARPVQAEVFDQDQVKAVFLYNLTNFITWPAKADRAAAGAFTIGVFGHDNLGMYLENVVSDESANHLPIIVRHYASLDEIESAPCQMLFINAEHMHFWPQIRAIARQFKILTVGDAEGFSRRGGIVGLLTSGRRIRIQINLEEGRRNGFTISAKLLKLAQIVNAAKDDK